jgi:hypothetical protein
MGRSVQVSVLPKCDFCNETAKYDARTKVGQWAYMCTECFKKHGVGKLGTGYGQEFVLREPLKVSKKAKTEGETVQGKELTDFDDMEAMESLMMGDGDREVECPVCGEVRGLEVDASYFHCECGRKVLCSPLV